MSARPPAPPPPPPPPAPPPPPERYRLALYGGGTEEIDRFALRDRIRRGEIDSRTQLSRVGSDEWKPTAEFPELARYLGLAREKRAVAAVENGATSRHAARAASAESLGERVVRGLLYPVSGQGFAVLLLYGLLGGLPVIGVFAMGLSTAYTLVVIRNSAMGDTTMPPLSDVGGFFERVGLWLKALVVSVVAFAPVAIWVSLWWSSHPEDRFGAEAIRDLAPGLLVTFLFSVLYAPACLAAVAVWENLGDALNPAYVLRLIRTMGADYVLVLGMWMVVSVAGVVAAVLLFPAFLIPLVGHVPATMALLFTQFYNAHILGWALYKHSAELGWD